MRKLELFSFLMLISHGLFSAAPAASTKLSKHGRRSHQQESPLVKHMKGRLDAGETIETMRFIDRDGVECNALHKGVVTGDAQAVGFVLQQPESQVTQIINGVDSKYGHTPLFTAVACFNTGFTQKIVDSNADVNERTTEGESALDRAVKTNYRDGIRILAPHATTDTLERALETAEASALIGASTGYAQEILNEELDRREQGAQQSQPQSPLDHVKAALEHVQNKKKEADDTMKKMEEELDLMRAREAASAHVQNKVQPQNEDLKSTPTSDDKPVSKSKSTQRNIRRRLKAKAEKAANNNSSSKEESAAPEQDSSASKQQPPAPEQKSAAAHEAVPSHPIISSNKETEKKKFDEARKDLKRESISAENAAILQASRGELSRAERMKLHELTHKLAPAPIAAPVAAPVAAMVAFSAAAPHPAPKASTKSSTPSQASGWPYGIPPNSKIFPPQPKPLPSEEEEMEQCRRHIPKQPLPEKVSSESAEKGSDEKSSSDGEDIAPAYPKSVTFEVSDGTNLKVNTHHAIVGDRGTGKHFLEENDNRKVVRTSPGIVEVERPAGGKTTCYTSSPNEIIPNIPEDFNADLTDFREQQDGRLVFTTTREASKPGEDPRRPKHTRFVVDPATGKMGFFPVLND